MQKNSMSTTRLSFCVATALFEARSIPALSLWPFLRPCHVGDLLPQTLGLQHCFALLWHFLEPISFQLCHRGKRPRNVGVLLAWPFGPCDIVLLCHGPFLGHTTSIFHCRIFLRPQDIGDSLLQPFFAAFWGHVTLFVLPWSFLGCTTLILCCRGFFCGRETLGFHWCGPKGPGNIVCAAAVLFGCMPWSLCHHSFFVDAFWRENADKQLQQWQLTATCCNIDLQCCRSKHHGSIRLICNAAICNVANWSNVLIHGIAHCRNCIIPQQTLQINPQLFCLKKNFLESWGSQSCIGLFSFKKLNSNQPAECAVVVVAPEGKKQPSLWHAVVLAPMCRFIFGVQRRIFFKALRPVGTFFLLKKIFFGKGHVLLAIF